MAFQTGLCNPSDSPLPGGPLGVYYDHMLPPDYHMHTPLCHHAVGEPVEYARRARDLGLSEIGFTDHSPMARDDFDPRSRWRMLYGELDDYIAAVELARREVPEVTIRIGLEVDFVPGHENWIQQLAELHGWDFFIGSVHYLTNDFAVDDPLDIPKWKDHEPQKIWQKYFELLTQAAGSGLFDIVGHADLPKKFSFQPPRDYAQLYDDFLGAVARTGIAIELNTAGLRKDCKEIYPSRQILESAFARRIPITFGSDAHAPEEVGADFEAAVWLALEVGYQSSIRFEKRQCRPGVMLAAS